MNNHIFFVYPHHIKAFRGWIQNPTKYFCPRAFMWHIKKISKKDTLSSISAVLLQSQIFCMCSSSIIVGFDLEAPCGAPRNKLLLLSHLFMCGKIRQESKNFVPMNQQILFQC
eukprot:TRINITY_DN2324_c0_g1_i1.p3 TRINITY_DN2324_c0_g1~~TRINITY_DN2324_c0_g1_i1.p3  ORF type:complete len:113 (-),score=3.08 TRINITY_DN2324_c0_g1_i1:441-779(-)